MRKIKFLTLICLGAIGLSSLAFVFKDSQKEIKANDVHYSLDINSNIAIENNKALIKTSKNNIITFETNGYISNNYINLNSEGYFNNFDSVSKMESLTINFTGNLKIAIAKNYEDLDSSSKEDISTNEKVCLKNQNFFKLYASNEVAISSIHIDYYCDLSPSKNYFDVVFDSDGGFPIPNKQIIKENELAIKPSDPKKDNYIFNYWYLDNSDVAFDFANPITKDTCLTAKYTYNSLEELILEPTLTSFEYGSSFSSEGLITKVKYKDGSILPISKGLCQIDDSKFNSNKVGKYEISVTYNDLKSSYKVDVVPKKRFKVLMVGNSFAVDTMNYFGAFASDLAIPLADFSIATLYHPACTIDMHYQNALNNTKEYQLFYFKNSYSLQYSEDNAYSLKDGLLFDNWDIISFQQGSDYTGVLSSYSNLGNLISYCKNNAINPNVKTIFNETWALADYYLKNNMPQYNQSQLTMYNMIRSVMNDNLIKNLNFEYIVPINTALQIARTSIFGDAFNRDGRHLVPAGMYLASMTFFCKVTGQTPDAIKFVEPTLCGENEPYATNLMRWTICNAVNLAINNPNTLSESAFSLNNLLTSTSYEGHTFKKLDLGYKNGTYYNSASGTSLIVPEGGDNRYIATKRFSKSEIPSGSLIIQKSVINNVVDPSTNPFNDNFYGYRAEGWINEGPQTSREGLTYLPVKYVNDSWWRNYNYRAFNIFKGRTQEDHGSGLLALGDYSVARDQFVILVPNI